MSAVVVGEEEVPLRTDGTTCHAAAAEEDPHKLRAYSGFF
jgi:hypothetical protein